MTQPAEKFTHAGLTVKLYQDLDVDQPDNDNSDLFLVTTSNRYFDQSQRGLRPDDCRAADFRKGYHVLPLIAYIHSGVALSLGREYPFSCPWDSGQIGFVCVQRRAGFRNIQRAAQTYIESWNQFLSGDVYYVVIEDEGEDVDSCGGFYGLDYARTEAKVMAEYAAAAKGKCDHMVKEAYAL